MLGRKRVVNSDVPNLAELLEVMAFYKQVDPKVHTLDLLKYAGFNIKGLQGSKGHFSRGHQLAWNDTLSVGICMCGWKGEEGWQYEMTKIQHGMHTRRASNA